MVSARAQLQDVRRSISSEAKRILTSTENALRVASSREESIAASLAEEEEQTDMLREALKDLDIDALSPRDALDQLYALKSVLEQEE